MQVFTARLPGAPVLGRRLASTPHGKNLFDVSYDQFMKALRGILRLFGVPRWSEYGSHAVRQGAVQNLLQGGGCLREVLQAGGWASRAFLEYQNRTWLDEEALAEALCLNSGSELASRFLVSCSRGTCCF